MKPQNDKLDAIHATLFPGSVTRGNRTRLEIVRATIAHLHENGIASLTFESIGKRVGMNKAQIRYHFKTQEELIDKVIDYAIAVAQSIVVQRLENAKNWRSQIYAIAHGFFDWLEEHPSHGSVLLLLYYSASVSKGRCEFHSRMTSMGFNRTKAIFEKAKNQHRWSKAKLETLSVTVWAIIDGMMLYHLTTNRQSQRFFRDRAIDSIKVLLS